MDWIEAFLDLGAMDVWMDAGLAKRDSALAARCRDAGLTPADLSANIHGYSVLYRITHGEPVEAVAARLGQVRGERAG